MSISRIAFSIICTIVCAVPVVVVGQQQCGGTGANFYTIFPTVDVAQNSFIYECQNTSISLAVANVSLLGVDRFGTPTIVDQFNPSNGGGTTHTITPALSASAATLTWDVVTDNSCMDLVPATFSPVYCTIHLLVDNFGPTAYLDFESLYGNNHKYSLRIRLFRASGPFNCNWQILSNVSVEIKDCNEYPAFDASMPTVVQIAEYSGNGGLYAGTISSLLVNDPDVFNSVWGNVTLSIVSVYRPALATAVDPTPFYISNPNFNYIQSNDTNLKYNVSLCPVPSTCLTMFDALYDYGGGPPYYSYLQFIIKATDGGGLSVSYTLTANITQVHEEPVYVNLPATVTISENIFGPQQIYPIQFAINDIGVNTWSVTLATVNPPVDGSGGTFFDLDPTCNPVTAAPVYCNALNLTNSVTNTTFDYYTQSTYNLTIWAVNIPPAGSGIPPVTATSSIIVNLTPRNYQPDLLPTADALTLTEDVAIQDCIYDVVNIPSDRNNDTLFFYTLKTITATSGATGMWYLNGTAICYNGVFASVGTCCSRVFRDTYGPYVLEIEIKDAFATPTPYPIFTFTVNIVKVDDPPVIWAPTTATVPETWTNFTIDINGTQNFPSTGTSDLVFNVSGQSTSFNSGFWYVFRQNSTRFVGYATLTIAGPGPEFFDFLTVPIMYLNVTVSDGIYTVQDSIIIYVQYVNRRPEYVNLPNSTTLLESTTGYSTFFSVTTTDKENDLVTYEFLTPSGMSQTYGYFSIDYYLGAVYYVNPAFDWFATSIHTLPVLIQDHPSSSPAKNSTFLYNLTVSIILVNQPPSFVNPTAGTAQPNSTISVYENATGQAIIYTFDADDRENDTLYYNITEIRPITNTAFNINWGTDVLEYNEFYSSLNPMFNHSEYATYWIVVEVKDEFHLENATSTTTITISILHVDKPARWTSLPATLSIREDVYFGPTHIYTVGASDPQGSVSPSITLLGIIPVSGTSKFFFDNTTNTFGYQNNPQFEYDIQNSYTAFFTAHNGIDPAVNNSLAIAIVEITTAPFSNASLYNYTVTLNEDEKNAQLLWDLRAQSNHSFAIRYAIQDVTPGTGAFFVTSEGLVKLISEPSFNYNTAPNYTVQILATDSGPIAIGQQPQTTTFTLTVSILRVPDEPTITNLPHFAVIDEGIPGQATLFYTDCTDPDNLPLNYSHKVQPVSAQDYFKVWSNGTVQTTLTANFAYWTQPKYLVFVECHNTYHTTTGTLTVAITQTSTTVYTGVAATVTSAVTTTTQSSATSTGLTDAEIGAICGSIGGALLLAGIAALVAHLLKKKAAASGLTNNMKNPTTYINHINLD